MFGSTILDTAIGVVFVYLLLSLACTSLSEAFSALLSRRARFLELWITRRLLSQGFATRFYAHPLIRSLSDSGSIRRDSGNKPSYVPSSVFVTTLFDLVGFKASDTGSPPASPGKDVEVLVAEIQASSWFTPEDRQQLLAVLERGDETLTTARQRLESWFDGSMDRLSGLYKRKTQLVVAVIAAVVTVFSNADTLMMFDVLARSAAARATLVAAADDVVRQGGAATGSADAAGSAPPAAGSSVVRRMNSLQQQLDDVPIPLGWSVDPNDPAGSWRSLAAIRSRLARSPGDGLAGILCKLVGLALTVLAVSLGAPFWFDLLNRLVTLRSAGRRPDEDDPTSARTPPASQGSA